MPWRLILFIIVFVLLMVFIMFNLDNRCDINFGFKTFENIPVFLTVFSSFIVGFLCALPFLLSAGKKQNDKKPKDAASSSIAAAREKFIKEHSGSADKDGGASRDKPNGAH